MRMPAVSVRATAVCALFALTMSFGATAQQIVPPEQVGLSAERLERIGELMGRHIEAGSFSGAVTLVARNGQIAHLEAHGLMNIEAEMPMRTDTIFRFASMTKPMAAAALLMLVEEGRIKLNDPVARYLPSYANQTVAVIRNEGAGAGGFGGPPPEYDTVPVERPITIVDLLTHTSGFMSGRVGNAATQQYFGQREEIGVSWVAEAGAAPLDFQPGSRWSYSAVGGFDVIAHIVEVVSGQSFDQFLAERLFEPLGMEDIFYWPTEAQRERLANSYMGGPTGLRLRPNPDSMSSPVYFSGAGGLMGTAEAYGRFAMMLANGGELDGVRVLSPRAAKLMGSPVIEEGLENLNTGIHPSRPRGEGFGLGVNVITDPVARRSLLSPGSFSWSGLYGTYFWVDPQENLVAVLMVQTYSNDAWFEFESVVMQTLVD
jgi:CubicO group peptidase (beta-lactamase class C family)